MHTPLKLLAAPRRHMLAVVTLVGAAGLKVCESPCECLTLWQPFVGACHMASVALHSWSVRASKQLVKVR